MKTLMLIISVLLASWHTIAMTSIDMEHSLNTQGNYLKFYQEQLLPWWQSTVIEGQFQGVGGVRLSFAKAINPKSNRAIIFINGRTESYLKYQETAFDFFHHGYHVFLYDHRGQGLSERLLPDPHQGYVDHFSDYVDDLDTFYQKIVQPHNTRFVYLIGHSMGGLITLHYLLRKPAHITKAALSAPMLQINFGFLNESLALHIAHATRFTCHLLNKACYAPFQGPYHPTAFANNLLSSSPVRYAHHQAMLDAYPQIQLGGPTNHWLIEAIGAGRQAMQAKEKITTPFIVLQGQADQVVSNHAQNQYCQQQTACIQKITLTNARHELFIEEDNTRRQTIEKILAFFAS